MKDTIIANLNNPRELEKLYRHNKTAFSREFASLYPSIQENLVAQIWNERLHFETSPVSLGNRREFIIVMLLSSMAAFISQIPEIFGIEPDYFFSRNISFIVFPALCAYFAWKQKTKTILVASLAAAFIGSAFYINLLPSNSDSDSLLLAGIHLPLVMWGLLGFTSVQPDWKSTRRRMDFLRYNGDLVVMATVIAIAGALLTGITLGLFSLIDLNIEEFYFRYIVTCGLAALPIISTFLIQANPQLVNKVSPVISRIFTPLVLVTLLIYLAAVIYTGKDPYNDREFLLLFNVLLIGVMALILFAVSGNSEKPGAPGTYILFALAAVTITVNGVALSAIVFRISEWGFTPNRLAVLGGNVLILIHLLTVTRRLFQFLTNRLGQPKVEQSITSFLPVYVLWASVIAFLFPVLFGFR